MRRLLLLIVVAIAAGWFFTQPEGRARIEALRQKGSGARPEVSWAQTFVSLAPISWRPGIRARLKSLVDSLDAAAVAPYAWDARLDLPAESEAEPTLHTLRLEPTACMRMLDVHLSILPAGVMPHEMHQHEEEEMMILLSGNAEVYRPDADPEPVGPGRMIYHASEAPHTIRAGKDGPARYLVFKWRAERATWSSGRLESGIYGFADAQRRLAELNREFGSEVVFESPTLFLKRLHAHVSRAQPGAGYPSERDPYDIALVLLAGAISTGARTVAAPAVVFFPADEPHQVHNTGSEPAEYLIFEFHGHAEL